MDARLFFDCAREACGFLESAHRAPTISGVVDIGHHCSAWSAWSHDDICETTLPDDLETRSAWSALVSIGQHGRRCPRITLVKQDDPMAWNVAQHGQHG